MKSHAISAISNGTIVKYKLSPNDRKALAALQHDSRLPVSSVASKIGLRHHSVRASLEKLRANKLITPYVLCNPHALGLTDYCIFFNCIGDEKGTRRIIIDHCKTSHKVAYFAELTGAYQYSVSLFCRTIFEVTEFFELLNQKIPKCSFDLHFAIRLQFCQFLGRWSNPKAKPILLDRKKVQSESSIDEVDRLLLAYTSQHADTPIRDAARIVGLAETTVRYRLLSLERRNIILGYPYLVDHHSLGRTSFRILLATKGNLQSLHEKVFDFMYHHPASTTFVRCAGVWDFELNFEVDETSEVGPIIGEVTDSFSTSIRSLNTLHEIAIHRAHHFPLFAGVTIEQQPALASAWRK